MINISLITWRMSRSELAAHRQQALVRQPLAKKTSRLHTITFFSFPLNCLFHSIVSACDVRCCRRCGVHGVSRCNVSAWCRLHLSMALAPDVLNEAEVNVNGLLRPRAESCRTSSTRGCIAFCCSQGNTPRRRSVPQRSTERHPAARRAGQRIRLRSRGGNVS